MDPFATTTGREPPRLQLLRWIPQQVHQYQKESALGLSVLSAILAVCLLLYALDASAVEHDTEWASLPWVSLTCSVQEVGVAYRGDCRFDTSLVMAPNLDFAECAGPADTDHGAKAREAVHREWLRLRAGQCAAMGDRDYRFAQAKHDRDVSHSGEDAEGEDLDSTSEQVAGGLGSFQRRLFGPLTSHAKQQLCNNAYLAWALVGPAPGASSSWAAGTASTQGANASQATCAYRFGASKPSTTGDWDEAERSLGELRAKRDAREALPCWKLRDDDCVVAFSPPERLAELEKEGGRLAGQLSASLGLLSFGFGLAAAYLHFKDNGCLGFPPPGGYHSSLPTRDPHEPPEPLGTVAPLPGPSALSDRVLNIVRAAASRLGDATPSGPSEGELSLRASRPGSRRTIEVTGAGSHRASGPRNIAADFLLEASKLAGARAPGGGGGGGGAPGL